MYNINRLFPAGGGKAGSANPPPPFTLQNMDSSLVPPLFFKKVCNTLYVPNLMLLTNWSLYKKCPLVPPLLRAITRPVPCKDGLYKGRFFVKLATVTKPCMRVKILLFRAAILIWWRISSVNHYMVLARKGHNEDNCQSFPHGEIYISFTSVIIHHALHV
jgi:hypothetical protein